MSNLFPSELDKTLWKKNIESYLDPESFSKLQSRLHPSPDLATALLNLVVSAYRQGYQEGKQDLQLNLREMLGVGQ